MCTPGFKFPGKVSSSSYEMFEFLSAETDPHEGKRKVEAMWPIFRLHHQRSRYIYDLFYRRKAISRGSVLFIFLECHSLRIDKCVHVFFIIFNLS